MGKFQGWLHKEGVAGALQAWKAGVEAGFRSTGRHHHPQEGLHGEARGQTAQLQAGGLCDELRRAFRRRNYAQEWLPEVDGGAAVCARAACLRQAGRRHWLGDKLQARFRAQASRPLPSRQAAKQVLSLCLSKCNWRRILLYRPYDITKYSITIIALHDYLLQKAKPGRFSRQHQLWNGLQEMGRWSAWAA